MKKVIKKYWGIGLIIVLISSLFIAAAPVSAADPLNWEPKTDSPSGAVWGLAPGTDILDFDVNGATMYAALGTYLVQTTGGPWANITSRLPVAGVGGVTEANDIDDIDFVAIAPDDPNVVVVVDSTANGTVAISTNGGASFSPMNLPNSATTVLSGVEISPMVTGGVRYIAVFGRSDTSNDPILYYYNYGPGVGSWTEAVSGATWGASYTKETTGAQDDIMAMKFSPNFPSDFMAVAVAANTGNVSGTMELHIMSFNSLLWDASIATLYPITSYTGTGTIAVNSADVALLPDYDGSDESLRIAFVGASIADAGTAVAENGGVFRHYDNAPVAQVFGTSAAGVGINSVAFDGTNLAVGSYDTNNVYRSADPMATAPTFLPARSLKKIGLDQGSFDDAVQVMFAGETLYGAKQGTASALSKSLDYGYTWNDFTLMDSGTPAALVGGTLMFLIGAGTIDDIYVSAAGDPWYMAAHTADNVTSVYRMSMFSVTRVLTIDGGTTATYELMLRGIDSDPDVIYAADKSGTVLYYSADGGLGRWFQRNNVPAAITDMAVESNGVIYIGSSIRVWKSVNSGFTWGLPVDTKLSGETIATMLSLGENNLLVGGSNGGSAYTTDGGASWSKTFGTGAVGGAGASQIAATGLAAGDFIFVAPAGNNQVYRCLIGPTNPMLQFKSMNLGAIAGQASTGLLLKDGVLYTTSANATESYMYRSLAPAIPSATHSAIFWGTTYGPDALAFTTTPSALKAASGAPGSIVLNVVDTTGNGAYYFDDTVALGGPSLIGPADGTRIDIVSPLTGTPANVNFTWERMSLATGYYLFIALDAGFTEMIGPPVAVPSTLPTVSSIQDGSLFLPGTTYYWRVSTYLPVSSSFSETRSFVVQPTAASVPAIASPENGGTIDSTSPAFSWTPAAGATLYQFQLSTTPDFATTLVDEQLASAGIAPAVALDRGTTYFWRVKALQPVDGDWSTVANFMVAMAAPAPTPPVVIETVPPPVIEIPPAPPANVIEIPPAPPVEKIAPAYIWAIIIIGAVLVIAVIVLVVRTRRQV